MEKGGGHTKDARSLDNVSEGVNRCEKANNTIIARLMKGVDTESLQKQLGDDFALLHLIQRGNMHNSRILCPLCERLAVVIVSVAPGNGSIALPVWIAKNCSCHHMISGIDVRGGAGDIAGENRRPTLWRSRQHPQWVMSRRIGLYVSFVHQLVEVLDTRKGLGLHGAGRQGVDANALRAELGGKRAHRSFEGGFHRPHDVLVLKDLLRSVVAHRQEEATLARAHQRFGQSSHANATSARIHPSHGRKPLLSNPLHGLEILLRTKAMEWSTKSKRPNVL